jgi:hypothetical protein
MSKLDAQTFGRILQEYPEEEQETVAEILSSYTGPERNRVLWDILELSKGDSQKLLEFVRCAQTDYRDILYWAEYFDTDPMLKGRNPRELAEDLLNKWGRAN